MRSLAFCVKFPGRFSVLSFQSLRYSRKSFRNWNLKSENNERIRMKGNGNLTNLSFFRDHFQMFVESSCFNFL